MNIVVISGEVITKVDFKFIYGRYGKTNKHTSIARCMLKLDNESIVQICGYDNMADFIYRNLQIGYSVICEGNLVIGTRKKGAVLFTLPEKKTREEIIIKLGGIYKVCGKLDK